MATPRDFDLMTTASANNTLSDFSRHDFLKMIEQLGTYKPQPFIALPEKFKDAVDIAAADAREFGIGAIKIVHSPFIEPVCAVQVSPDFPWITPEGRDRINAKFVEMFGKTQDVAYMFDAEAVREFMGGMRDNLDGRCMKMLMGDYE